MEEDRAGDSRELAGMEEPGRDQRDRRWNEVHNSLAADMVAAVVVGVAVRRLEELHGRKLEEVADHKVGEVAGHKLEEVAGHKLGEVAGHNEEEDLLAAVHGKAAEGLGVDKGVQMVEVVDTG